jgi:hypothetical protein
MSLAELSEHDNVYPADVAELAANSINNGWSDQPIMVLEKPK